MVSMLFFPTGRIRIEPSSTSMTIYDVYYSTAIFGIGSITSVILEPQLRLFVVTTTKTECGGYIVLPGEVFEAIMDDPPDRYSFFRHASIFLPYEPPSFFSLLSISFFILSHFSFPVSSFGLFAYSCEHHMVFLLLFWTTVPLQFVLFLVRRICSCSRTSFSDSFFDF
jgi:hypothetical protein